MYYEVRAEVGNHRQEQSAPPVEPAIDNTQHCVLENHQSRNAPCERFVGRNMVEARGQCG